MADGTLDQQITYLEKLLTGYKERFLKGERSLEPQLRATAAKIEQLKLKKEQEAPAKSTLKNIVAYIRKRGGCCGR